MHYRSMIISHVLEESSVQSSQDITSDLFKHRFDKSKMQIDTFTKTLNRSMNPLTLQCRKDLILNISAGEAVPNIVSDFSLNIEKTGPSQRKSFIDSCDKSTKNVNIFVVKNIKVHNFISSSKSMKIKLVGKQEVKLQRDIFGCLLAISLEQAVNTEKVLWLLLLFIIINVTLHL